MKEIAGAAQRTAITSEPLQDWRGSDVIADDTIFFRNTLCILFRALCSSSQICRHDASTPECSLPVISRSKLGRQHVVSSRLPFLGTGIMRDWCHGSEKALYWRQLLNAVVRKRQPGSTANRWRQVNLSSWDGVFSQPQVLCSTSLLVMGSSDVLKCTDSSVTCSE